MDNKDAATVASPPGTDNTSEPPTSSETPTEATPAPTSAADVDSSTEQQVGLPTVTTTSTTTKISANKTEPDEANSEPTEAPAGGALSGVTDEQGTSLSPAQETVTESARTSLSPAQGTATENIGTVSLNSAQDAVTEITSGGASTSDSNDWGTSDAGESSTLASTEVVTAVPHVPATPVTDRSSSSEETTTIPEVTDPSMGEMKIHLGPIGSKSDNSHDAVSNADAAAGDRPAGDNGPVDVAVGGMGQPLPPTTAVPLSRHRPAPGLAPSEKKPSRGRPGVDPLEMLEKPSKARTGVQDLEMLENPSKPRKGVSVPQDSALTAEEPKSHTSEAKESTTGSPSGVGEAATDTPDVRGDTPTSTVVGVLIIIVICLVIGFFAFRRLRESWYRRHYRKMDFLVDGMYNL